MLCLEQEQQASDPEEVGKDGLKDVGPATLSPPLLQEEPVFSVAPEKPFHVLAPKATRVGARREARAAEKPCPSRAERPGERDQYQCPSP